MTSKRDLNKIAASLTPKQHAILMVRRAVSEFGSLVEHLRDRFPRGIPFADVVRNYLRSMETSQKNRSKDPSAVRRSQMQVGTLLILFYEANLAILRDVELHVLRSQLLAAQLSYLLAIRQAPASESSEASAEVTARARSWREQAISHGGEVFHMDMAIQAIQERYFDGTQILFRESVRCLQAQTGLIEKITNLFNSVAENRFGVESIDMNEVRDIAKSFVEDKVRSLTELAKASVLMQSGNTTGGVDILKRIAFEDDANQTDEGEVT